MPLFRYQVRAEYGLADPELYTSADKDDPEALLEGVAMAGLVGVLRQLGDLAEFAADIFNGLHEEVMVTSARGHSLMLRVQQLEAEIPAMEKAFLSQTSQPPLDLEADIEWHPNRQIDHNLFTQGDMPRFILNSYEECRGPPKLFMLDRFDVAGAGACLKRYSDPSFFKNDFTSSGNMEPGFQREMKPRKAKRKGIQSGNDDNLNSVVISEANPRLSSSSEKVSQNMPAKRVKLKARSSASLGSINARSFMENLFESHSVAENDTFENTADSFTAEAADSSHQIREVHEVINNFGNVSHSQNPTRNPNIENVINEDTNDKCRQKIGRHLTNLTSIQFGEEVSSNAEIKAGKILEADTSNDTEKKTYPKFEKENSLADGESISDGSVDIYVSDDVASELDNYVDALNTLDSEAETDNESKIKSRDALSSLELEVLSLEKNARHATVHVKSLSSNFTEVSNEKLHHDDFPRKKVSRSMDSLGNSIHVKSSYQVEHNCLDHRNSESRSAVLSDNEKVCVNGDQNNLLCASKEPDLNEEAESFDYSFKTRDYNDNAHDKPCSTSDISDNGSSVFEVELQSCEKHFDNQAIQRVLSDIQNTSPELVASSEDNKLDQTLDTSCTPSELSKASVSLNDMELQPFCANSDPQFNVELVPSVISGSNTVHSLETSSTSGANLEKGLNIIPINNDHASEVSSTCASHFEVIEKNGDLDDRNSRIDVCQTEMSDISSDLPSQLSVEMVTTKVIVDNICSQGEGLTDVEREALSCSPQDDKYGNALAVGNIYLLPVLVQKETDSSERDESVDNNIKSEAVCSNPTNNICSERLSELVCSKPTDNICGEGLSDGFIAGSVVDIPSNGDDSICLEFKVSDIGSALSESGNELQLARHSQVESWKEDQLELHQQSLEDTASSIIQNSSYSKEKPAAQEALHDLYVDEERDERLPVTGRLELLSLSELDSHKDYISPVMSEKIIMGAIVDSEDVTLTSTLELHSAGSVSEEDSTIDATSHKDETLRSGPSSPKSSVRLVVPNHQGPQKEEVESPSYHSLDKQQKIDSSDEPHFSVLYHVSQGEPSCPEVCVEDNIPKVCNGSPKVRDEETSSSLLDDLKMFDENSSPSNHCFPDVLPEPSSTVVEREQHNKTGTLATDPVSLKESADELTPCSVMNQQEKTEVAAAHCDYSDSLSSKTEFAFANENDLQEADKVKENSEPNTPISSDCLHSGIVNNIWGLHNNDQIQGDVKLGGEAEVESFILHEDPHPDYVPDGSAKSTAFPSDNHCSSTPSSLETDQASSDTSSELPSGQCTGSELLVNVAQSLENMSISDKHTDPSDLSPDKASLDSTNCMSSSLENSPPYDTVAISSLAKEQERVPSETCISLVSRPEFGKRSLESTADLHMPQSTGSCNNEISKSPEEGSIESFSNADSDLHVNKSILKKASEALMGKDLLGFHISSQNSLQCHDMPADSPPLPPLPPLQWRVGKLRPGTSITPDLIVNENLCPGPNTLPPVPFPESLHGYSFSVAEKEQPVNPFVHVPSSGNANSLPYAVSEGTNSPTESILPVDDGRPVLPQAVSQEGVSSPVNNFMAMPGFTNPASLDFSSHPGGQFPSFQSSRSVAMSGHKDCSTDLPDSNEVPKASNPFLSTSSSDDIKHQYAYNPYAVFGDEGMHILNASMPLPTQALMPHPFFVHRGDNLYSPYSIPLLPMDMEMPNGRHHSLLHRPRDPLIEAVASHDKSTLRKVSEMNPASAKPKEEGTNPLLEQIRKKSVNLKPAVTPKPNIKGPSTNLKVAAILEKANAIRQACAGSDEDEDSWSDS